MQRLAALFGEEFFVPMLEVAGESPLRRSIPSLPPEIFEPEGAAPARSPYAELEGVVHELGLAPMLEFHLWAYPHYRSLIESDASLHSRFKRIADKSSPSGVPGTQALVEEAVAHAEAWLKLLPIPEEYRPRAESAAKVPWLRFRAEVLEKAGERRLGTVG